MLLLYVVVVLFLFVVGFFFHVFFSLEDAVPNIVFDYVRLSLFVCVLSSLTLGMPVICDWSIALSYSLSFYM